MNHAEAIYQTIPSEVKRQFEISALVTVSRLIEEIESKLPFDLSNQEVDFFRALGNASKDGSHGAVYEAFGRILTDE
jgi:hypothetical protein